MLGILERVPVVSSRPRFTMLVFDLSASPASQKGNARPWVQQCHGLLSVREWISDAAMRMAARNSKRLALTEQVRNCLEAEGRLHADAKKAAQMVDFEVRERVRLSGLTGVSRAITELIKASLISRHCQGYRVDHENRGTQRHGFYIVRAALSGDPALLWR